MCLSISLLVSPGHAIKAFIFQTALPATEEGSRCELSQVCLWSRFDYNKGLLRELTDITGHEREKCESLEELCDLVQQNSR